jgi:hypothetical protein
MSVRTQPRAEPRCKAPTRCTPPCADEADAGTLVHRLKQGEVLRHTLQRVACASAAPCLGATPASGSVGALAGASALAMLAASGAWSLARTGRGGWHVL